MFWERLKALCDERNITPAHVAKELDISSTAVYKWKEGGMPKIDKLITMAEYFNVSIDYLLGLSDQKEKTVLSGQSLTPMQAAALDMILNLPDSALLNLMSFLDALQNDKENRYE